MRNENERYPARGERGGTGNGGVEGRRMASINGNFSVELLTVPGERPVPSHMTVDGIVQGTLHLHSAHAICHSYHVTTRAFTCY